MPSPPDENPHSFGRRVSVHRPLSDRKEAADDVRKRSNKRTTKQGLETADFRREGSFVLPPLLFSCKLEDATKGKQESGRRDLEKRRIKISAEKKDRLVTWKKSRKYPRGRLDIKFGF